MPFFDRESGPTTSIKQSLSLVGQAEAYLQPCDVDIRTDLMFTQEHNQDKDGTDENSVRELLNRVRKPGFQESQLPSIFRSLVHSMRKLQHSELVLIHNEIAADRRCKKLFEDALPLLKTDPGISLMRDIIKSESLDQDVVDTWFYSLTFYKNPTRAMLTVLSTFLEPNPHHSALLGISSLASTFCAAQTDCLQFAEIRELVKRLELLLGTACKTSTKEEEDTMVLVLKGIRNIGLMTDSGDILGRCYKTKSNPMWVRVAAVETVQSLACHYPEQQFDLLGSFTDIQEDSELRIAVYRALMACPSESVVEAIKVLLTREQVNQGEVRSVCPFFDCFLSVGSYVWTHLTNLQETESKDEWRKHLSKLIGSDQLQNKWRGDVRKFSRNVEFSQFLSEWRVGGTVDSNIIFSERSYIPRAASVNLTTSLFGENVNLFEVGLRAEGFEKMFEELFGPEGYFREDTVHEFLKHLPMRSKREVDAFHEAAQDTDPRGSLSLRFFGKDIRYASFDGLPAVTNFFNNPLSIFDLANLDKVIEYEKSTMFLDGAIITPTVAGLPLKLVVQGTTSIKLDSDININLVELFKSGKAELDVDLRPSATVEIICVMGVDAVATKTELKSTTKLHTATDIGGSLHIDGKKLVKAQMKMPSEKLELFEASVNYFVYNEGALEELNSYQKEEDLNYCTPGFISEMFGVETCGHLSFFHGRSQDDPTWIYAGPSQASISLKKTDTFTDMIVKYAWTTDDSNPNKGVLHDVYVIYDTPGSTVVRKTIFEVKFDEQGKYSDVDLIIPALDIKAQLKYDWMPDRKNLTVLFSMATQEILRLSQSVTKFPNKFEGVARLVYFGTNILDWTGSLHSTETSGRYSLVGSLAGLLHPEITVTGDLTQRGNKYEVQGNITSDFLVLTFTSDSRLTNTTYKLKGTANYSFLGGIMNQLDVVGKSSKLIQGELTTSAVQLDLNVSVVNNFHSSPAVFFSLP